MIDERERFRTMSFANDCTGIMQTTWIFVLAFCMELSISRKNATLRMGCSVVNDDFGVWVTFLPHHVETRDEVFTQSQVLKLELKIYGHL
jgi:hypothetical protein